jgi:hypothetical protein
MMMKFNKNKKLKKIFKLIQNVKNVNIATKLLQII